MFAHSDIAIDLADVSAVFSEFERYGHVSADLTEYSVKLRADLAALEALVAKHLETVADLARERAAANERARVFAAGRAAFAAVASPDSAEAAIAHERKYCKCFRADGRPAWIYRDTEPYAVSQVDQYFCELVAPALRERIRNEKATAKENLAAKRAAIAEKKATREAKRVKTSES